MVAMTATAKNGINFTACLVVNLPDCQKVTSSKINGSVIADPLLSTAQINENSAKQYQRLSPARGNSPNSSSRVSFRLDCDFANHPTANRKNTIASNPLRCEIQASDSTFTG